MGSNFSAKASKAFAHAFDKLLLIDIENNAFLHAIEAYLDEGADPNIADQHGKTMLHYLCMDSEKNLEKIKILLERGANPTITNNRGHHCLQLVIDDNPNLEAMKLLFKNHSFVIERNAALYLYKKLQYTPTKWDIIELLVKNNFIDFEYADAIIFFKTLCENQIPLKTLKVLLEKGVDLNANQFMMGSPLYKLCQDVQNLEVLKFLSDKISSTLASTALSDHLDRHQWDDEPLNAEFIDFMLAKKPNLYNQNQQFLTYLCDAKKPNPELLEKLLKSGFLYLNNHAESIYGASFIGALINSPLYEKQHDHHTQNQHRQTVMLLISYNMNVSDYNLSQLYKEEDPSICLLLLNKGKFPPENLTIKNTALDNLINHLKNKAPEEQTEFWDKVTSNLRENYQDKFPKSGLLPKDKERGLTMHLIAKDKKALFQYAPKPILNRIISQSLLSEGENEFFELLRRLPEKKQAKLMNQIDQKLSTSSLKPK